MSGDITDSRSGRICSGARCSPATGGASARKAACASIRIRTPGLRSMPSLGWPAASGGGGIGTWHDRSGSKGRRPVVMLSGAAGEQRAREEFAVLLLVEPGAFDVVEPDAGQLREGER